jgi:hypothetical protein
VCEREKEREKRVCEIERESKRVCEIEKERESE